MFIYFDMFNVNPCCAGVLEINLQMGPSLFIYAKTFW